jgi:hypothetical protein
MIKCFFLERTTRYRRRLRRFVFSGQGNDCPGGWIHAASVHLDTVRKGETDGVSGDLWPHDDPHWPPSCEKCGYAFQPDDEWQLSVDSIWRRADTGEEITLHEAPPGAMWYADWLNVFGVGPDGRALVVRLPDGTDWQIDGRATSCTLPDDKEHHCWIRHGTPPLITVDKQGNTCAGGAGSIGTPNYHGFLRDGHLRPA